VIQIKNFLKIWHLLQKGEVIYITTLEDDDIEKAINKTAVLVEVTL